MNEQYKLLWQDFVVDLIDDKKNDVVEDVFQDHIEAALRLLGWSKAQGEICPKERINVGSCNQVEPDITLKQNGESQVVIEAKRPSNKINKRQEEQLLSYMRIRKLPFGFYIGDEIKLYYDVGEDLPFEVWNCKLDLNSERGVEFVDFLNKSTFNQERLCSYCKQQYKLSISQKIMSDFSANIQNNADGVIRTILTDYFTKTKKCNRDIVNTVLSEYVFSIVSEHQQANAGQDISTPMGMCYAESRKMNGKDWTKYSLDGGMTYCGKGKFVYHIVKEFLEKNPNITYNQLIQVFPDSLQGSYGVIRSIHQLQTSKHDAEDLKSRYVMSNKLMTKDNVEFVVCNQWGKYNFENILNLLKKWGWNILQN